MGARQEAVDPYRVEHHQHGDESDESDPQRSGTVTAEPRDGAELAELERNAEPNDRPEGAGEDAGQATDREGGRAGRERERRHERCSSHRNAAVVRFMR